VPVADLEGFTHSGGGDIRIDLEDAEAELRDLPTIVEVD
jgi:hypothetical protein